MKVGLFHDYLIDGMPWTISGNFIGYRYRVYNQSDKNAVFHIQKEANAWDNRYYLEVNNSDYILHGICLALAVDAAMSAMCNQN